MSWQVPKTNWLVTDGVSIDDLNRIEGNTLQLYNDSLFQVAGGTATALTINTLLVDRFSSTFIASANNNGAATTINGKPLYKPNTTTAPTLIAGRAYTVWFNQTSNCYFIKGGAEGTALAEHVLKGYTFSNDRDTGIAGTALPITQAIKSIQYVTTLLDAGDLSITAPISPVNPNNSVVAYLGRTVQVAGVRNDAACGYLILTNSTTVTASRDDATTALELSALILEFDGSIVKRKQSGIIDVAYPYDIATAVIDVVNPAKTLVCYAGHQTTLGGVNDISESGARVLLYDSMRIKAYSGTAGGHRMVAWNLIEFR